MKKPRTFPDYLPSLVLLVLLLCTGVSASLLQAAPPKLVPPKETRVNYEDLDEYNQYMVQFHSQTLLERDRTEVSFAYALPNPDLTLWLGYTPTNGEKRADILVSHPQLTNLTWEVVDSNQSVFLYQRVPSYESIEAFLANPPDQSKIVIDSFLKRLYPQFEELPITDFEIDLDSVDYILTTYKHPEYENGVYYFERTIDASEALLNAQNAIEWYLRVPELMEEPSTYLMGNIIINYRQY